MREGGLGEGGKGQGSIERIESIGWVLDNIGSAETETEGGEPIQ